MKTRRVVSRPATSIPFLVWILLIAAAGSTLGTIAAATGEGASAALILVPALSTFWFAWMVWGRMHCVMSPDGIRAGGSRRRWIRWSDFTGFERDGDNQLSEQIYADSVTSERLLLFGVPFYPLLLDSLDRHERAVKRALAQLERARREVTADGNG